MKNTITLLLAMLTGTACMAPMDDDPITHVDEDGFEEIGESEQSLTRKIRSRDGDACSVTVDGGTHDGTMQGNMCCFDVGGLENCYNCLNPEIDCTSPRVFGGGFGSPRETLGF